MFQRNKNEKFAKILKPIQTANSIRSDYKGDRNGYGSFIPWLLAVIIDDIIPTENLNTVVIYGVLMVV